MSYVKVPRREGIFRNTVTGKYMARITINGKQHKQTFDSEYLAAQWRLAMENGEEPIRPQGETTTLRGVWEEMQSSHFPTLAKSTQEIWRRRFELLQSLEHLPMGEITPSRMMAWVEENVAYFKSEDYENSCRGQAKRCNLDNELNLLVTIFNWYKNSEKFEAEAINLTNPVKTSHKKKGFIRAKPIKDKSITLEAALQFFSCLKPLYRDLALFQYFTASRISEASGLQWERVDFENRRITIIETCRWDMSTKVFVELNKFPKNREPRQAYMTDEIMGILKRRLAFKRDDCGFVFHVDGKPLNYGTIQLNYREGQRISRVPYTGTHILRHGMARLARKVGGGLDAVIAMTGHKDYKLADHYSKLDSEYRKEIAEKIQEAFRSARMGGGEAGNVLDFARSN